MRRQIWYSIILAPLIVALLRARTHPYFATNTPYQTIQQYGLSLQATAIIAILLSVIVLTAVIRTYQHAQLPAESFWLLLMSPPVLAAAVLDPLVTALGLLALIGYWLKDNWFGVLATTAAVYLHPAAILLSLALSLYYLHKRYYAAGLVAFALTIIGVIGRPLETAVQFAELQVPGAISIIALILAIFASVRLWNQNTAIPLLICFAILIPGAMLSQLSLVVTIISAALGGIALRTLRTKKWALTQVKMVTLYFVLLGLLFAAVASTSQTIQAQPDEGLLELTQQLQELTNEPIATLSTQQAVLRTYGVDAVDANAFTDAQTSDELISKATQYLLLEDGYIAPQLRFLLENTNTYTLIEDAGHDLYVRTVR